MTTFDAKFLDSINKSKTHDYKSNLSPMILEGNQLVFSLISLVFGQKAGTSYVFFQEREKSLRRRTNRWNFEDLRVARTLNKLYNFVPQS